MRKVMKRKRDRQVFKHTAVIGKKVNVMTSPSRGGIRM